MNKKSVLTLCAAVALLVPAQLFASGFGYYEHGAKATAVAGAFVAQADDASAIYYNPAGIAFLEGTSIYGAIHPVKPSSTARIFGTTTDTETGWQPPSSAFVATNLTSAVKFGVGVFIPYGLEVKWPKNWVGSQISQRSYLRSIYIRPTVAFQASEKLALGIGLDFVTSKVTLEQQTPFSVSPLLPSGRADAVVEGTGTGYGFTAGLLFKASDKVQFGAKYQHEVEIDFEGDVDFTYIAAGHPLVDGFGAALFVDQNVKTTITMPAELVVGVMFKPAENFNFEVDFQWTKWDSYQTLDVQFDNPLLNIQDEGNWDNSWMIRIGGEYWVAPEWAVRAGYIHDTSPIPDNTVKPILPDSARNEVTFGLGYDTQESCCWGNFRADFALQYVKSDERTSTFPAFPATYEQDALIFGVGFGITF